MAIVRTTPDIVSSICGQVRQLYDAERKKIDITTPPVVPGLAEYFIDLLFPLADQKKIIELYPEGAKPLQHYTVGLQFKNAENTSGWATAPVVHVHIQDCLSTGGIFIKENLPGIKKLQMSGPMINVELDEDVSALPTLVAQFAKSCAEIHTKFSDASKRSKAAVENMRNFLKDHRTLQSALKAMPALKFYLDQWITFELERKVEPKERKPKAAEEKKPYDMTELITKAAINRLSL